MVNSLVKLWLTLSSDWTRTKVSSVEVEDLFLAGTFFNISLANEQQDMKRRFTDEEEEEEEEEFSVIEPKRTLTNSKC